MASVITGGKATKFRQYLDTYQVAQTGQFSERPAFAEAASDIR